MVNSSCEGVAGLSVKALWEGGQCDTIRKYTFDPDNPDGLNMSERPKVSCSCEVGYVHSAVFTAFTLVDGGPKSYPHFK